MEMLEDRAKDARRETGMIDPYMAGKMADYTQGELARSRGRRDWKTLFTGSRSKSGR
jgi:hypothetical protein